MCKRTLEPLPTPEWKKQEPTSIYAITKKDQEDMCLLIGKTYGIKTTALRYFNVFGPRQSLSNPYTGVVAIFLSRLKNGNPPIIFEDGKQCRDFISVYDVVEANILAMKKEAANYEVFNVGTGKKFSVLKIANELIKLTNSKIKPIITGKYRKGDIRHCFADVRKIESKLGFRAKIEFPQCLRDILNWSTNVRAIDKSEKALKELKEKGLA